MLVVVTALVVYPLSASGISGARFSSSLGSLFALCSLRRLSVPHGARSAPHREDDGGVVLLPCAAVASRAPTSRLDCGLGPWRRSQQRLPSRVAQLQVGFRSRLRLAPRPDTVSRRRLILVSHAIIAVSTSVIAGVGYASYCDSVEDNVVDSLPASSTPALAARAALVFQLCCGLPLRFHVIAGAILPPGRVGGRRRRQRRG